MLSKAFRVHNLTSKIVSRAYSALSNTTENPGRVVFISQSTNIYSNLAFEDWLYKNWNFNKRHVLFLWRNSPCVVIGRHQNPYTEANIEYLESAGVPVVRRNSGGGTVYHDEGNLNCTFFTCRERYNRRQNLNLICHALKRDFNIWAQVNKKDDLLIGRDLKISGTAAKLGRLCAYHHCTLLVSTDKLQLMLALRGDKTLKSKATESVSSPVGSLQESSPGLSVEKVLGSIARNYLEEAAATAQSDGFTLVNPTEEWFPGMAALEENLRSWSWFHGMTPAFKVTRPVAVGPSYCQGSDALVTVEVNRGLIRSVSAERCVGQALRSRIEGHIAPAFLHTPFTPDFFLEVESRLIEDDLKPRVSEVH